MSGSREELQIQVDKLRKIRINLEMSRKALFGTERIREEIEKKAFDEQESNCNF